MVMIVVPGDVIYSGRKPVEAQDYIGDDVWLQIIQGLNSADSEANCLACTGEILCCVCLGVPLILCHCCIAGALADGKRSDALNRINRSFYGGSPVLSTAQGNGILINTDFLPTYSMGMNAGYAAPAAIAYNPSYASPAAVAYAAPAPAPAQQMISVTIPQGVNPGDTMTVQANGTTVNVTVPSGVYAGQTIQVQVPSSSPSYASAAVPTANPVSSYAPAPAASSRRIRVTIPPGVSPGSVMQVMTPEGTKVEITVPPGKSPGEEIEIAY